MHLRDTLDTVGLDQPLDLAEAFDDITEGDLGPWYDSTVWHDRWRLRDAIAASKGEEPLHEQDWTLYLRFANAVGRDPELSSVFWKR